MSEEQVPFPPNKFDHHKFEIIAHQGFLETLNRCADPALGADFDDARFVECVKASGINYNTFARQWLKFETNLARRGFWFSTYSI